MVSQHPELDPGCLHYCSKYEHWFVCVEQKVNYYYQQYRPLF